MNTTNRTKKRGGWCPMRKVSSRNRRGDGEWTRG